MKKPELFNESHAATYCMEDDKLRLYVGRVPRPEYDALRAEGWTSTPKQSEAGQGEFAATWTPERRDTALSYAGIIGDEDASPQERAADRAERFGGYRDKRLGEATGHADRYESGPSTHGFQSEARAERAVTAHQLFQTPPDLAERLVAAAGVRAGMRVLEPSAGLGRILDALPFQSVTAIEVAPQLCAELFKQEREGVTLMQRDFLTVLPDEIGHFDRVVMNPPFTMRSDLRHISHALDFLKMNGTLAAICMDTPHREAAFRERAATWEKLPPGTFKSAGTNVPCVMFTLKA